MKKLSFKWRISISFALIIILLSVFMTGALIGIYKQVLDTRSQNALMDAVEKMSSELQDEPILIRALHSGDTAAMRDEWLYSGDVIFSYYDASGERLDGIFPLEGNEEPAFADGGITSLKQGEDQCYIYDRLVTAENGASVWIRGVVYSAAPLVDVLYGLRYVFVVIPVFVIIALASGYFLTGRFLKPVNEMRKTARDISQSGEPDERISLPESKDELYALAETFNGMFDSIQKQFEVEKQFSSNASHELRTPVSVILAECDYALEDAKTQEELLETIGNVQEQGYRMKRLIEELLIFTRIQQGSDKYPKESVNIRPTVEKVIENYEYIALEKHILIESDLCDAVLEINTGLFELMISNLLGNACKYGRENGTVRIKLEKDDEKILLSVSDDGRGIREDDLPYIWERFYRSSDVRDCDGSGLGLSLVREIAAYHGGAVKADSEYGKGSVFTITF